MKAIDLYNRVVESTGLATVTPESLHAGVANCMADLTSRGYKFFTEQRLPKELFDIRTPNLLTVEVPEDIRKLLYVKVIFSHGEILTIQRVSLMQPQVKRKIINGVPSSDLLALNHECIFYINDEEMTVEWLDKPGQPVEILLGYFVKLQAPRIQFKDATELARAEIDIRKEFEDAIVLYLIYFYISKTGKDIEKIQMALNNYKYYVEDILHQLSHEDTFYENDAVVRVVDE